MPLVRRFLPLLLLTLAVNPTALHAQAPFNACVDRTGTPIPSKTNTKMGYAGQAGYDDGKPMIWWNAKYLDNADETEQLFVYLHECAHHTLGHLWDDVGKRPGIADENEADCWAVQLMAESGMIRTSAVDTFITAQVRRIGDGEHLGGDELVRALRGCLTIRTSADAWAAALPPLIEAAKTQFTSIRGRELEAAEGRDTMWESTLDVPGTYDCEVMGSRRVRCIVFLSKNQKPAATRYKKLEDLLSTWLPAGWNKVENPSPKPPFASAFHMQDPATGVVMSLLLAQDAKLYFVVNAPQS